MQKYLICRDVYACKIDDSAIFLHLGLDKYFTVPPSCMPELDDKVQGFSTLGQTRSANPPIASETGASTIDSLLASGILTESEDLGRPASYAAVCLTEALPPGIGRNEAGAIHAEQCARFFGAFSYVRTQLYIKRLRAIIRRFQRRRDETRKRRKIRSSSDLSRELSAFLRLRSFFYTAKDHCLLDSLILTEYLNRGGFDPTFVIGVRTRPFLAHAWVQLGECLIDGCLESTQGLTPVLVI